MKNVVYKIEIRATLAITVNLVIIFPSELHFFFHIHVEVFGAVLFRSASPCATPSAQRIQALCSSLPLRYSAEPSSAALPAPWLIRSSGPMK